MSVWFRITTVLLILPPFCLFVHPSFYNVDNVWNVYTDVDSSMKKVRCDFYN